MAGQPEVILVDVGSSSIKITEVIDNIFVDQLPCNQIVEILSRYNNTPLVVSSVRKLDASLKERENALAVNHLTPMPIQLDYDTPETLRADRIAAAVGANEMFPGLDNLVIDLGTCMTIDLVDRNNTFRGGVISPGLKMRMRSMSQMTDALPDISDQLVPFTSGVLGKSTRECLWSGSYWSILHEINGVIRTLGADFTSLNIILTGGDAHYFESKLKAHIFAGSKIVQRGLYRIWKYQ